MASRAEEAFEPTGTGRCDGCGQGDVAIDARKYCLHCALVDYGYSAGRRDERRKIAAGLQELGLAPTEAV